MLVLLYVFCFFGLCQTAKILVIGGGEYSNPETPLTIGSPAEVIDTDSQTVYNFPDIPSVDGAQFNVNVGGFFDDRTLLSTYIEEPSTRSDAALAELDLDYGLDQGPVPDQGPTQPTLHTQSLDFVGE